MSQLGRILAALLAALALLAGAAAPAAYADDGGLGGAGAKDNTASAENTKDDSSLFRFAFSVREVSGDVVDETNSAVAYASCERCQTVAIALQVVIVTSETTPSTITPQNVAIAVNENCASCQTLALAYQFVVGRGGPVSFTEKGRRQAARIVRSFRRLEEEGLSLEQIRERAELLRAQLADVLRTELVPADRSDGEGDDTIEEQEAADRDRDRGEASSEPDGRRPPETDAQPSRQPDPSTQPQPRAEPQPEPPTTGPAESPPTSPEPAPEQAP